MTRKEYLNSLPAPGNDEASHAHHRAYYAQFATPSVLRAVQFHFDVPMLQKAFAEDRHGNSIEVDVWDQVLHTIPTDVVRIARELGGGEVTRATRTCIVKECARLWAEGKI